MPVTINGDGLIEVGGTSTTQGRVRLAEDTDNGSNYVELTAPASVTANRTVTFPDANVDFSTGLGVAQGGTGTTSLTANNVLLGNGTSAVQVVAPGSNGNILTSNGTTWTSAAPASSYVGARATRYTGNGTFTIPTGITAVKVTIVGGGGGSAGSGGCASASGGGGGGGTAIRWLTGLTPGNTISVTVGAGGTAGGSTGAGGAGGSSQISSGTQTITTVTGGGGGGTSFNNNGLPGTAGTTTNADQAIVGAPGGNFGNISQIGGASYFSVSGTNTNTAGAANTGAGAGGSNSGAGGAAGGAGVVIFEY